MIEKEDIKIGLEFILPIRLREYEEEVARFRHRQIMGEDEACEEFVKWNGKK